MFVQANSYRKANRTSIDRIVFHTAEIQEQRDSAERVAAFFSNPSTKVSAHAVVDNNSLVECVLDKDVAFHAFGDNEVTLGLEMSGFARQTPAQWNDAYSKAMLERASQWAADKATKFNVPVRWLTEAQLRREEKGFVTHDLVSKVFGDDIRDDPGPHFPYQEFLALVKTKLPPPPLPPVDHWEIQYRDEQLAWAYHKTKTPRVWVAGHSAPFKRGGVYIRPKYAPE
jgi:hypothetical protein